MEWNASNRDDAVSELPVFVLTPDNESDTTKMKILLEKAVSDDPGTGPEALIADKGYVPDAAKSGGEKKEKEVRVDLRGIWGNTLVEDKDGGRP